MSQVELYLSHTRSFNNARNIQHVFIICLNANSFKWVPVELFKLAHDASYNNRCNSLNIGTIFFKTSFALIVMKSDIPCPMFKFVLGEEVCQKIRKQQKAGVGVLKFLSTRSHVRDIIEQPHIRALVSMFRFC